MERPLSQRLIAESVGAFTLVFVTTASIVVSASLQATNSGLVTVGFASGLAVAVMVSGLAHVSGAHFNPAVTVAAWVTQKIDTRDALAYILVQLAGAAAGAGVMRAAVPETLWRPVSLGTPLVSSTISNGQAVLFEALLTFILVWVVFSTTMDPEGAFGKIAGLGIGLTIVMGIFAGGPLTGAAMNPARSFGPAAAGGFWSGWWVYWIGPVAGGIVAATIYDTLILRPRSGHGSAADHEVPHEVGAHGADEPGPAPRL